MAEYTDDHTIQMNCDSLDDGSIVVNFDLHNTADDEVVQQSGYVHIRQDDDDHHFYIVVFNADGDVVSETALPFNWHGDHYGFHS